MLIACQGHSSIWWNQSSTGFHSEGYQVANLEKAPVKRPIRMPVSPLQDAICVENGGF